MTDKEQQRIFSANLVRYVSNSGKDQKDVAKDLSFNEKTFNGWCNGVSMPGAWKIQKIADYFHIAKSQLLDEWDAESLKLLDAAGRQAAFELIDEKLFNVLYKYSQLSEDDKQMVIDFINRLYDGQVKST